MIAQFDGFEINQIHSGDIWKICNLMVANADRLKRYFPNTLEQNLNPTLSKLYVENKVKEFEQKQEFIFTLKQTETRKLAGIIGVKELDWNNKKGEFSYCIDYNFEGQGLTSKSVKSLSDYAFETLGLKTLQIITYKDNIPSVKVAEKCGYKWIKTLRNEFTPLGEHPLDMELYELNYER